MSNLLERKGEMRITSQREPGPLPHGRGSVRGLNNFWDVQCDTAF